MLGYVYNPQGRLSTNQDLGVKVATPVGTVIGQFLFGWLADIVGRKRMCTYFLILVKLNLLTIFSDGIELMIIIVATIGQVFAGQAPAVNILAVIIVWRGIRGIGIGGDYPLSAVITSEFASTHTRGRLMTLVLTNQGWGQFAGALVTLILVHAYKSPLLDSDPLPHLDQMWRSKGRW